MPGFRYCQWCDGKGCIGCDAEKAKFEAGVLARAPSWRPADVRDLRDATVEAEIARSMRPGLAVNEYGRIDALTPDEVEAAFKPLLDAEYKRQFPNGPTPIFTARAGNAEDMALLKEVFHADKIKEAFGPGGGGIEEIELRASVARAAQEASGDDPGYTKAGE